MTIESLKRRAEKLVEKEAGKIVLIFTDHPEEHAERIAAERARGNIPLVFPEEDRDL